MSNQKVTAFLNKGSSFEGKLSFEGVVRLGGQYKGEIFSHDTLIVEEGADIEAQIEADTVIISGEVRGNIFARSKVILFPPARFTGTVTSPNLAINEGVLFEGASYMPQN